MSEIKKTEEEIKNDKLNEKNENIKKMLYGFCAGFGSGIFLILLNNKYNKHYLGIIGALLCVLSIILLIGIGIYYYN
jgi:hypothetical protein